MKMLKKFGFEKVSKRSNKASTIDALWKSRNEFKLGIQWKKKFIELKRDTDLGFQEIKILFLEGNIENSLYAIRKNPRGVITYYIYLGTREPEEVFEDLVKYLKKLRYK